jgi:hypothetical protein
MVSKNDIISKLKIENLSEDKQDEIIQRFEDLIQRRVFVEAVKVVSNEDIPENKTESEIIDLLRINIPNFDSLVKDVAIKTVDEFVEKMG